MNRRSNAACLTEREVEEFLFNRLSGVTREVIEEHLLVCQRCQDTVEKEEDYLGTIRAAARVCEEADLERAFSGAPRQGLIARLISRFAQAVGWSNRWLWTVALASLALVGTAILWQYRTGGKLQSQEVTLELHRGAFVSAQARAGVPLNLSISVGDLAVGAYSIELVDAAGTLLAKTQSSVSGAKLVWRLENTYPAGTYWIRLRRPEDAAVLVREYGLKLVR
jgi:hypothetical protein